MKIKAPTVEEFIKKKGLIVPKRTNGKLDILTIRLINWYRDEWVFIHLEKEWLEALKRRQAATNNIVDYVKVYLADQDIYQSRLKEGVKAILNFCKISEDEYEAVLKEDNSIALEDKIAEIMWSYYAFQDSDIPKILSDAEILKAFDYQREIAKTNNKFVTYLFENNYDEAILLCWLGDMMQQQYKVKYSDYLITIADKRILENPEVHKSYILLHSRCLNLSKY